MALKKQFDPRATRQKSDIPPTARKGDKYLFNGEVWEVQDENVDEGYYVLSSDGFPGHRCDWWLWNDRIDKLEAVKIKG